MNWKPKAIRLVISDQPLLERTRPSRRTTMNRREFAHAQRRRGPWALGVQEELQNPNASLNPTSSIDVANLLRESHSQRGPSTQRTEFNEFVELVELEPGRPDDICGSSLAASLSAPRSRAIARRCGKRKHGVAGCRCSRPTTQRDHAGQETARFDRVVDQRQPNNCPATLRQLGREGSGPIIDVGRLSRCSMTRSVRTCEN